MAIKLSMRDRISKAAEKEFLRSGFEGARTQSIADAAGINKALLHYYFRGKQELYEHVLERQFASLFEGLFALLESDADFDAWLRGISHKYLHEVASKPNFARFVVWELSGNGPNLPSLFKKLLSARGHDSSELLPMIRQRLEKGGLEGYDPLQFLLNLLSLCVFPFLAKPLVSQLIGTAALMEPQFIATREEEIYLLLTQGIFREGRK